MQSCRSLPESRLCTLRPLLAHRVTLCQQWLLSHRKRAPSRGEGPVRFWSPQPEPGVQGHREGRAYGVSLRARQTHAPGHRHPAGQQPGRRLSYLELSRPGKGGRKGWTPALVTSRCPGGSCWPARMTRGCGSRCPHGLGPAAASWARLLSEVVCDSPRGFPVASVQEERHRCLGAPFLCLVEEGSRGSEQGGAAGLRTVQEGGSEGSGHQRWQH